MREAYRVLKQDRVAIMSTDGRESMPSLKPGKEAGFQPVGHLVFQKQYSSKSRFFHYQHEQAYLLAKGRPLIPKQPLSDVNCDAVQWQQTASDTEAGNSSAPIDPHLHLSGELVLDPFAGSTAVRAQQRY